MKKLVITGIAVFLLVIFIISLVNANIGLAPGKLHFDLNPGIQNCQNIVVSSSDYSGTLKVRDIWTDKQKEYNTNHYNKTAAGLGMQISYTKQIDNFNGQQEVEVCLTANNLGNYTGDLIFTPGSDTNIVVEVGAWLFVNVSETPAATATTTTTQTQETTNTESQAASPVNEEQQNEEANNVNAAAETAGITGAAVGTNSNSTNNNTNLIWIVAAIVVIGIVVLVGYKLLKRKARWQKYGY